RACLQKDPKQRLGDAQSIRLALGGAFDAAPSPAPVPTAIRPPVWRRAAPLAVASLVIAVGVGVAAWLLRPQVGSQAVNRFEYIVPEGQQLRAAGRAVLALSDDGR